MFFVLIIGLSGDALTIGIALAVLVYALGPISGGHLNPAVTLSLAVADKISRTEARKYRLRQCIGAVVGALIFWLLQGSTMLVLPDDGVGVMKILAGEFIFTFLLAMVVFLTAVSKKAEGNGYRGAAIGLTVFIGAMCVGQFTGGVFNTAVAIGPMLVDIFNGGISTSYLWIYLIATLAGGAAAGRVIKHSRLD